MTDAGIYAGAAALGVVAGMRSTEVPDLVEHLGKHGPARRDEFGMLSRPITGYAAIALAAAEAAVDQLPLMPRRAESDTVAERAVSGASSGAAICSAKQRSPGLGALFGALGAVGAAYGLSFLHDRDFKIPVPLRSIIEDVIAAGIAILVLSKLDIEIRNPT